MVNVTIKKEAKTSVINGQEFNPWTMTFWLGRKSFTVSKPYMISLKEWRVLTEESESQEGHRMPFKFCHWNEDGWEESIELTGEDTIKFRLLPISKTWNWKYRKEYEYYRKAVREPLQKALEEAKASGCFFI